MSGEPSVEDMMVAYSQGAVDHARDSFGIDLDYSVDSVKTVETILARIYEVIPRGLWRLVRKKVSDDDVFGFAKMYGGYIGEVMRRRRGGEWVIETGLGSSDPVITLRKGDDRVFPPAKVWKRLTNGPEDDVWMYFQAIEGMLRPVEL